MAELLGRLVVALLAAALLLPGAAEAKPKRAMQLGYVDWTPYYEATPFDIARTNGARMVRFIIPWRQIAPERPADPTNPADPAYHWEGFDERISDAVANGFLVLVFVTEAPPWAQGADRPADAPLGSWRPDPAALAEFFTAATRHYSGRTPGVAHVRRWQVWNEPNLSRHLSPQGPAGARESPAYYRRMLNLSYNAIKREDPRAIVVTAGTAPYGDTTTSRTRPVEFWRKFLCLTKKLRRAASCPGGRARFDVWAHHPYGVGGPTQHARHPDDAAIPDLGRIGRVVRAAFKRKSIRVKRPPKAWVTEFSWDSSPPDPDGVPAETHARWLEGALFEFWKAEVRTALWFLILDQPPTPSFGATYQSGTNLIDGTPKLAAQAYQFPFVARRPGRRALVWGLAPRPGRVRIQSSPDGTAWRTVARARASGRRVFTTRLRLRQGQLLRAVQGTSTSLSWRVGVDG